MAGCLRILALGVFLLAVRGTPADESAPKFKVTTRKMDDTVQTQGSAGNVIFSVKSPSGIGSAAIERTADRWPATVMLKLHLGGLESFAISNGQVKLNVAVSSAEGKPRVRLWRDDKEGEPLDGKSPYWMDVRLVGADSKPADHLPLRNGHFEMTLPKAFLDGNPQSLSLQWIDFYRG